MPMRHCARRRCDKRTRAFGPPPQKKKQSLAWLVRHLTRQGGYNQGKGGKAEEERRGGGGRLGQRSTCVAACCLSRWGPLPSVPPQDVEMMKTPCPSVANPCPSTRSRQVLSAAWDVREYLQPCEGQTTYLPTYLPTCLCKRRGARDCRRSEVPGAPRFSSWLGVPDRPCS